MRATKLRVSGQVQGVFYRHSAQAQAKQLGLTGLARNESDGSVYIEVEGEDTAISQFIEWAKLGPPGAHVRDVETEDSTPAGHADFIIA